MSHIDWSQATSPPTAAAEDQATQPATEGHVGLPPANPADLPDVPRSRPEGESLSAPGGYESAELAELLDAGVKSEIDLRRQAELARRGRVAGAD